MPAAGKLGSILSPKPPGSASDFEDAGLSGQSQVLKNPGLPRYYRGAEVLIQLLPSTQVGRIPILTGDAVA
jgi:hypothetical protein